MLLNRPANIDPALLPPSLPFPPASLPPHLAYDLHLPPPNAPTLNYNPLPLYLSFFLFWLLIVSAKYTF